ncbi:MAG: hypothetical protein Q9200_004234 [Gallowayella weberi]
MVSEGLLVVIFHAHGEEYIDMQAKTTRNVPNSVVTSPILARLHLEAEPCDGVQIQDADGRTHVAVSKIELEWRLWEVAEQYSVTFYVLESDVSVVLLGENAFPDDFREDHKGFNDTS